MEVFVFLKTIDMPSTNAPKKLCHACNLLVPVQAKVCTTIGCSNTFGHVIVMPKNINYVWD